MELDDPLPMPYQIDWDAERGRLVLILSGCLNEDESREMVVQLRTRTADIHGHYNMLVDLTQFLISADSEVGIEQMRLMSQDPRMHASAIVSPQSAAAQLQFRRMAEQARRPNRRFFNTLEEANDWLDTLGR